MSGPSDLARLTVTIDTANELFLSEVPEMIDVGDGVMRPTNAKVLADLSTQMSGALIYTTTALGLAGTASGGYFSVISSLGDEYIILYRNSAGAAVEVDRYPNAAAIRNMQNLVRRTDEAVDYLNITDEEGGIRLAASADRLRTEFFELRTGTGFGLIDDEGGLPIYADAEKAYLGPMEVRFMDYPAVVWGNEEGEIIGGLPGESSVITNPLNSELLFAPIVAVAEDGSSNIYPQAILSNREAAHLISAGLFSLTQPKASYGSVLEVSDEYGPDAVLTLRLNGSTDARATAQLTIKTAPTQPTPKPLKVLLFADSIGNNQGAMYLKQFLEVSGYAPTFIGTVNGSVDATRFNADGPLGEARSGWEYGDYMFSNSNRALIVEPGAEATYLAMSKESKLNRNPFLRVAAVGDDPAIIQNGYVFDVAFYQTRFGLEVPDVVINAMGTNDATYQPSSTIYNTCLVNDTIFNRQIASAWPSAKVIRTIPATGIDPVRSPLWTTKYTQIIRAMKAAAAGHPNVWVAPLWAMINPDLGFHRNTAQPGSDGFVKGNWTDPVHPIGSGRQEYYKAMAPFVAVAALNL
ncbi:hypothetical protein [Pseudomonas sp. RA_35y_Pfl2_P32]|uniref:hypothetical protein n=1 Tax=Pseudomonas sp. RA_35y_Pfl2_P32 TaxID=3088705 RepID=UPI0030D7BCF2